MLFVPSIPVFSQGNLLITPVRVTFDGQKKMQELNLANTGSDTMRYMISFMEIRMRPDGTFEQIMVPDSGQHFASPYLRFFPRSVVLPPNEAQVVKLQLTKAGGLSTGEYRSHLYFRAMPRDEPAVPDVRGKDNEGIAVQLKPVFGITIPVIISKGDLSAQVSISDLVLLKHNNGVLQLQMVFNRSGDASVYGNVTVNHISPEAKVTKAGFANGMAVYMPGSARQFRLTLDTAKGINYNTGKLQVVYSASKKNAGAGTLASAELPLN